MAEKNGEAAVGIDLGTTYSCVAVWEHGRVEIITNDQGNRTTPSYVAFTDSERLIGDAAKNQVAMNPTNSIFGFRGNLEHGKSKIETSSALTEVASGREKQKDEEELDEEMGFSVLSQMMNIDALVILGYYSTSNFQRFCLIGNHAWLCLLFVHCSIGNLFYRICIFLFNQFNGVFRPANWKLIESHSS
ncbi:hypothetical protein C5167_044254 [Papaver somniferum]|uniref:Uncharacterized protein n=1 Tax=Papaver somniferum TaxID=3469 RepID=A0A4Y7L810_PAPSO|nr:hypothetical protein C5167_044254 [Papaver somniferum]